MSFAANLPLFCIVACLVCSVVSSVLNGKAARYLSMALCAGCCICSCLVLQMVLQLGEPVTYIMGHFPHPWGNEIRMGILESLFSSVFSLVMLLNNDERLTFDLSARFASSWIWPKTSVISTSS